MTYNPDLKEALEFEKQEVGENLEDLMAQFLQESEKEHTLELDEMQIRKMMFAIKYIEEEAERLKRLKTAVVAEWDRRIAEKTQNVDEIKAKIKEYVTVQNKGKALKLDIGTASLRKVKHNLEIKDKAALRIWLSNNDKLENFLKPAELDTTLAKNHLLAKVEKNELALVDLPKGMAEYKPEDKSLTIKLK